jgi:hypothetical protein
MKKKERNKKCILIIVFFESSLSKNYYILFKKKQQQYIKNLVSNFTTDKFAIIKAKIKNYSWRVKKNLKQSF